MGGRQSTFKMSVDVWPEKWGDTCMAEGHELLSTPLRVFLVPSLKMQEHNIQP